MAKRRTIPSGATERAVVACDGSFTQVDLLYALSATVVEAALYGPQTGPDPAYRPAPPLPEADGVYYLIDNKWIEDVEG